MRSAAGRCSLPLNRRHNQQLQQRRLFFFFLCLWWCWRWLSPCGFGILIRVFVTNNPRYRRSSTRSGGIGSGGVRITVRVVVIGCLVIRLVRVRGSGAVIVALRTGTRLAQLIPQPAIAKGVLRVRRARKHKRHSRWAGDTRMDPPPGL